MALTSRQMEQCCPHFKAGTIVLSVEIYNRKYMHMLQKTFQVDSVTDVFGLRTCWPERFMFKEEMLVSVFLAESFLFSFLIDRCHLFRRRQEFLLFPCACTSSISCCCCCDSPSFRSVEKISQSSFSPSLSSAGESTIWIQDDGLQVLHHYQERSDRSLFINSWDLTCKLLQWEVTVIPLLAF